MAAAPAVFFFRPPQNQVFGSAVPSPLRLLTGVIIVASTKLRQLLDIRIHKSRIPAPVSIVIFVTEEGKEILEIDGRNENSQS